MAVGSLFLPLALPMQAGLVGFSVALYCAVILLLFVLTSQSRGRVLLWIPVVALLLGLIRPDGVILGAGFVIVGFVYTSRSLRGSFARRWF